MHKALKKIIQNLIYLWACFASLLASAQEPVYRLLDYSGGLPSNTVYNILQDSKGFVWIGHDKGLTRYNGADIKNYSNNMNQSRALSNLEEDIYGRIWCQNFSGEIFYTQGDSLLEFKKFGSVGNFISMSMYQKQKIVTSRNGVLKLYDVKTKELTSIGSKDLNFYAGNINTNGNAIIAQQFSKNNLIKISDLKQTSLINLPKNIKPFMYFEVGNVLYVLPRSGELPAMIQRNGKQEEVKLKIKTIIQYASVIGKEIWIATSEGVYTFDMNLKPLRDGKALFPELNASKIIQDHEGNVWVSSLNKGVVIITNLQVQLIKSEPRAVTVASYFPSTDKIILGTGDNKIYEFNPYSYKSKLLFDFEIRHDVVKIYNDISNDLIWISSDKMHAIKPATNTVEFEQPFPLKDIDFMEGSTYAVAGPEGVSLFNYLKDTVNNKFSDWYLNGNMPWFDNRQLLKGSEGRAKCVAYDAVTKTLFAGNYKGLFYWTQGRRGQILDHGEPIYASDILIKGNKVYVCTYGGSLYEIADQKIVRSINGFVGLEKKSIISMVAQTDNLWLLFENALVKYNVFTRKYIAIRTADGLPNTEIKDIAVLNNKVFLATRIGLIEFPENMGNSIINPRLEIEDIYVNKIRVSPVDSVFDLRTEQNNLEINFSVLSYKENSDLQVYYSINGKGWILHGSKTNKLNLVGLSPGVYNIRLKVVNPGGKDVVSKSVLHFKIASPVWARWWFILLVVFLLAFLAYSFLRFRLNELRKEAEFKTAKERMEKELQLSTLASIKSQMNPHFVFNALNTVQSYIFTNDKDNAIEYLNKFSDLTRMILDMSNREMIPLSEEIKALNLYLDLESARFEDNFNYKLIVNDNVMPELIQIPSMLIQPYVENAIKHGLLHKSTERKLRIEFLKENKTLVVFIDDNGIGRKKSQEMKMAKPMGHKSFATEANKKRLQLLNQGRENTIDIEFLDKSDGFGNPDGTMVVLAIPVNF